MHIFARWTHQTASGRKNNSTIEIMNWNRRELIFFPSFFLALWCRNDLNKTVWYLYLLRSSPHSHVNMYLYSNFKYTNIYERARARAISICVPRTLSYHRIAVVYIYFISKFMFITLHTMSVYSIYKSNTYASDDTLIYQTYVGFIFFLLHFCFVALHLKNTKISILSFVIDYISVCLFVQVSQIVVIAVLCIVLLLCG